jgi:hypothetical protein
LVKQPFSGIIGVNFECNCREAVFQPKLGGVSVALLAWSVDLPDWQRHSHRSNALIEKLGDADRAAIRARLLHAHGIAVEGEADCTPLGEADLPAAGGDVEPVILCGIGPVLHVDRLADNQELKCGVAGITLNFGDNGTGKSGYARVAKKLASRASLTTCNAMSLPKARCHPRKCGSGIGLPVTRSPKREIGPMAIRALPCSAR